MFFGANSVQQLLEIARDLITTFASAGMELRKFSSNSEEFMSRIPEDAREHPDITTLGVLWDTKNDNFGLVLPRHLRPHHDRLSDDQATCAVTNSGTV